METKNVNVNENKDGMCRNILNEIRYLREQCDAIEKEANKGLQHDIFCGGYVSEKLGKAQSAIDEISKDISLKGRRLYL